MNYTKLVELFEKYDFVPDGITTQEELNKACNIMQNLIDDLCANTDDCVEIKAYLNMIGNAIALYESKLVF